jgi:hypothetical protein
MTGYDHTAALGSCLGTGSSGVGGWCVPAASRLQLVPGPLMSAGARAKRSYGRESLFLTCNVHGHSVY